MEELLRRLSSLNNDQIEEFINYVLIEIFNSVTEHGMPQKNKDEGWWMIAQHHQRHQFISLCIADNGIGIANSLYTGPQKAEIIKRIGGTLQLLVVKPLNWQSKKILAEPSLPPDDRNLEK